MMCDSRVEYDSEALYLNSLPSKISADVPPQYNLNCIFLLDHNRKLPPDDSEPFARQSSISFVERANSGFIMRRGLVTGFIAVACSAMVVGWMSWKQGRGSGFIFAVQGLSMAPTLLGEHLSEAHCAHGVVVDDQHQLCVRVVSFSYPNHVTHLLGPR